MKRWIGAIQVLLAGTGFGFLGIFGRWAFQEGFSVGEFLFWRFVFAAALMWVSILLFRPRLAHLRPKQIITSCFLGFCGYAVFSTLYFVAIQGVSVALAAMLLFTFPIFVSLGSHFVLRERMSSGQWISLVGACLGLVILLWSNDLSAHSTRAVLAGLGAAISYSIYVLVSGRMQKNVPPLSSSLYVITAAAIGLYLFHQPTLSHVLTFSPKKLGLILGIAVVCSIGPMTLFLAGLQKMKSSEASILVMIEPVMAAMAAWFFLNEELSLRQIAGAALIIGSLILDVLTSKKPQS